MKAKRLITVLPALGVAVLMALMALTVLSPRAEAASPWFVDPAGNDANTCKAAGAANACLTIQAAINLAAGGDTINVAAGTYAELAAGPLGVNKTLTILGAQSGVDARTRVGLESIVTDSQGTYITASNVVIDGFTFQDSTNGAFTGYGVLIGTGTTGTDILNNIIQDNIIGIGLANAGPTQVLIQHNLIQNNNEPGSSSGTGIYTDQFVCGAPCSDFLIDENKFVGNGDAGVFISNTDLPNPLTNLDVSENEFDMNGRAVGLINTDMSTIHDNTVTNSTFASADIRIFDSVNDLTILNNDLSLGPGHGIRLSDFDFFDVGNPNPSSLVEIHQNNIVGYALTGLTVDALSHTGSVDATCNWWGAKTGPTNAGNPFGTGDIVSGDAIFSPYLLSPAPGASCGKQVGGIVVDPDISALALQSDSSSGTAGLLIAEVIAGAAAAAAVLGGGVWYARRRRIQ